MSDLTLDRCAGCGTARLTGRHACAECGSAAADRIEVAAKGTVAAVTHVDRAAGESPVGVPQFDIAMVRLDAAPEVRVMGASAEPLEIGQAVHVTATDGAAPYLLAAASNAAAGNMSGGTGTGDAPA